MCYIYTWDIGVIFSLLYKEEVESKKVIRDTTNGGIENIVLTLLNLSISSLMAHSTLRGAPCTSGGRNFLSSLGVQFYFSLIRCFSRILCIAL